MLHNQALGLSMMPQTSSSQAQFINQELPELVFSLLSAPSGPEAEAVTITEFLKDVLKVRK